MTGLVEITGLQGGNFRHRAQLRCDFAVIVQHLLQIRSEVVLRAVGRRLPEITNLGTYVFTTPILFATNGSCTARIDSMIAESVLNGSSNLG